MERAARNISKSMLSYLKRAREHKEFLLKETKEFERSKRHLANMMGLESQEMTQEDIDDAIKYLFPSGLFDKRARPVMKHPDILFKAQKDAQFDIEGRPHHHLFYTVKPNYYESLNQLGKILRDLDKYEDDQLANGIIEAPDNSNYNLIGRSWLSHDQCNDKFLETITGYDYDYLIKSLEHLLNHPYSARAKSYIEEFSREVIGQSVKLQLPEIHKDEETGSIYTDIVSRRREHEIRVKTILNGTGKIDINGSNILYFDAFYLRRAIYAPLKISGMQDKVDIIARFVRVPLKLGESSVSSAIRYAVSQSVAAHSDNETREKLRLAGLLMPDIRVKERKKFGQEGARRKYTWKKR